MRSTREGTGVATNKLFFPTQPRRTTRNSPAKRYLAFSCSDVTTNFPFNGSNNGHPTSFIVKKRDEVTLSPTKNDARYRWAGGKNMIWRLNDKVRSETSPPKSPSEIPDLRSSLGRKRFASQLLLRRILAESLQ